MKLKDIHLRDLLLKELYEEHKSDPNTRIINELGIDFGASRIDVAVVNGIIHGFEIKSECDTLNRLPRQMEYYNKLFERMTIVIAPKYFEEVKGTVPKWWGIKVVNRSGNKLITKRKGRKKTSQELEILLKLLWKEELESLIDILGYPKKNKRLKKTEILDLLMQEKDILSIKNFVYDSLKNRQNWRN
ncbi:MULTISPECIES: sce7726 family protein [Bacillus cereus group]|uniref:sce7726 family protein n=1 Tax=Bacillus cereus group TaxID=86661 RepID=UPI000BEB90EB|nr:MULTISPECIES: sce7726 family protein [Bacillus cereus group]PDZ36597.1 hypothetical protein CON18_30020 [Bacillus cereus]PEQ51018.1 hypothetical protein CN473_18720 [Bacillus thuringiensis]PEU37166.1 hypothetical protein CN387_20520 [Bacillus cereus]PEY30390.1 hypothetical protein CN347_28980 [Bacillus cereus]PFJ71675.1 hypothetical protein COJ08_30325 [Bacillus cereus]